MGNRQYVIKEVYEIPKSKELEKMKNGLYKYIAPLILLKLIEGHDENNKISFTSNKWANQIHMVNKNYASTKYYKNSIAEKLEYDKDDVTDFFLKVDSMISSYFQMTLDYLHSTGSIIWREVDMVHEEIPVERLNGYSENGRPIFEPDMKQNERVATEDDIKFYTECLKKADDEARIEEGKTNQRYFGDKASDFARALGLALNERQIKYMYKAYEVYFVHLDWCKNIIKEFDIDDDRNIFIDKFNNEFIGMIMNNANDRYTNALENVLIKYDNSRKNKSKEYKYTEHYLDIFTDLCDITINNSNNNISVTKILGIKEKEKYNNEV
jgi:hypothetical protein